MESFYYLLSCFVEISELNANSVDPIRCHVLPMSLLWDAGLKWVNAGIVCVQIRCQIMQCLVRVCTICHSIFRCISKW